MHSTFVTRFSLATLATAISIVLSLLNGCQHEESAFERDARLQQERAVAEKKKLQDSLHVVDSTNKVRRAVAMNRFDSIHYDRVYVSGSHMLDSLRRLFRYSTSYDSAKVLAICNRKELRFIRVGDTLIVPDKIVKDYRAYSVFPQFYDSAVSIPKLVLISNKYQAYACYAYGDLVRFVACNTGSKGKPTFPGRYGVVWRQEKRISSLNDEWILPFTVNFHQYAGNAFHQFEMPGRPVSHSCIRQFLEDAKWLYKWVKTAKIDAKHQFVPFSGTPVIILDMFNYSRRRGGPWWDLVSNRDSSINLPQAPMSVEEALIPMSQIPKDVRGGIPNRKRYLTAEDTLLARGVIDTTFRLRESIDYNKLRAEKEAKKKRVEKHKLLDTPKTEIKS